jgi:hypothetical protein
MARQINALAADMVWWGQGGEIAPGQMEINLQVQVVFGMR